MCYITATELKKNLNKYMVLSHSEDVHVLKNGKEITVLTSPENKNFSDFLKLKGFLAPYDDGKDYKEILEEEICKNEDPR